MRHELYSELRTVYEATAENPRTFRLTIKLKDMVDEDILAEAVRNTMRRYPYFRVRLGLDDSGVFFEDNTTPTPVLHTDGPIMLGGYETQSHLLAFCWWKNKVHIDAWHALTDGGGIYPLVKTFLYYYCSAYYGRELSTEDIRLAEHEVPQAEWDDPARVPLEVDPHYLVEKWHSTAFQIADGGIAQISHHCQVYNIRISEEEFMRFNLSKEGSPGTIVALFLSRAIAKLHPARTKPIVIGMCVNQRKALRAPLAHQSLVGDVRLVFQERMERMDFDTQETCFRGMVALQSDTEMVKQELREYQELMETLAAMPTHEKRHEHCKRLAAEKSRMLTATVSYVGKASVGDAEYYVQEFHSLPSTALPSCETPVTLEIAAFNGSFYINFMQFFKGEQYVNAFIEQLREHGINYDVLYAEQTKYPGFVCPWR